MLKNLKAEFFEISAVQLEIKDRISLQCCRMMIYGGDSECTADWAAVFIMCVLHVKRLVAGDCQVITEPVTS